MSFVQASSLQVLADSMGVPKLSDEAAKALAPDVEYRMRDIIQEAAKFQRHSKRSTLSTDDISQALRMRNATPVYGFATTSRDADKGVARFLRVAGHSDLYFLEDQEVSFDKVIGGPLPRAPVEVGLLPHWLVVDGVQPAIPENAAVDSLGRRRKRLRTGAADAQGAAAEGPQSGPREKGHKKDGGNDDGATAVAAAAEATTVRAPVKHVLSQELQLYLDRVSMVLKSTTDLQRSSTAVTVSGMAAGATPPPQPPPGQLLQAILASLASDPGLQPVVPYLVQSIGQGVASGLRDVPRLLRLLSAIRALATNPALDLVPYLHQLLPAVLTCLVAKRLGEAGESGHWEVRDCAASVVHGLCSKYRDPLHNLQPRIIRTLLKAFRDASKPLTTHYGAVVGLAAMGHLAVREVLVPHLQHCLSALLPLLETDLGSDPPSNGVAASVAATSAAAAAQKREEATRLFGALRSAVSAALMRDDVDDRLSNGTPIDAITLSHLRLKRPNNKAAIKANPQPLQFQPPSDTSKPPPRIDGPGPKSTEEPGRPLQADARVSSGLEEMDVNGIGDSPPRQESRLNGTEDPCHPKDKSSRQLSVPGGQSKAGRHATNVAAESFGDGMQPYVSLTGASRTFI